MNILNSLIEEPTFRQLMHDPDGYVRLSAYVSVGLLSLKHPSPEDLIPLLTPFLSEFDGITKMGAVLGLGIIASQIKNVNSKILPLILPILEEPASYLRRAALTVLGIVAVNNEDPKQILDIILPFVDDEFPDIRSTVAAVLGIIGTFHPEYEATEKLNLMLKDSTGFVRFGAALGLGLTASASKDASRILELISPLLKDAFGDGRRGVALGLGILASSGQDRRLEHVLPLLNSLMKDKDGYVRRAVAIALGLIGGSLENSEQILELIKPLIFDHNRYAQSAACLSLGLVALNPLTPIERDDLALHLISNPEVYIRRGAPLGVGLLTREETIERSMEYLDNLIVDSPNWSKTSAAMALGQIIALISKQDPKLALEKLQPLMKSSASSIRLGSVVGFSIGCLDLPSKGSGWEMVTALDSFSHGWFELGALYLVIGLLRYLHPRKKIKLVTSKQPELMFESPTTEPLPSSIESATEINNLISTDQLPDQLVLKEIFEEWTLDRTYHELFCDTWKNAKTEINLSLQTSQALILTEELMKSINFSLVDNSSSQREDIFVAIVKGAARLRKGKKGLVGKITILIQEKKAIGTLRLELAGEFPTEFLSKILMEMSRYIRPLAQELSNKGN
ncbi:MAG: HEAT repeat domain-containing protein [Candidatus Hermodarchaeota archaeon]